jgi:hypothetical protein
LKNYLRCHCRVKNSLACESSQNAHLQHVNCAFSAVLAGPPSVLRCLAYVFNELLARDDCVTKKTNGHKSGTGGPA